MATTHTPINLSSQEYFDNALAALKTEFSSLNPFALPKIKKICINAGIGKLFDTKQKQQIVEYLNKMTGQKPKLITTRKSISGFKLRSGEVVGAVVTLRGKKMEDFLFNLVYVSIPRIRDFRGVSSSSFDSNYSCYSLGITNTAIFPTVGFDTELNFGIQINIVFASQSPNNVSLLNHLSFPFSKITK
jgi:large subunit ribosomal protein L5